MPRPVTRLRVVLPASPTVEALVARVADAWAVHGVQVRQQMKGAPFDGAPRADVALWLPDVDASPIALDARTAPARVHAAFVVEPPSSARALGRFDAIVVPHGALVGVVRQALQRSNARDVPVVVAKLPGTPALAREAEKALRGVAGRRVVVVDARPGFDGDIERIVVQLALKTHEAAVVLLAPHEEPARARVRSLCERHGVDAYLATGPDAFANAAVAADAFFGAPSWDELLLAALCRTPVTLLGTNGGELLHALRKDRVVDDVAGVLQLAAALDRKLADANGLEAKGIALRESLFGADQEMLEALGALEPLPQPSSSAWEPVGPHASHKPADTPVVDARDANAPSSPSRGQSIEDALEALKQRIAKAP